MLMFHTRDRLFEVSQKIVNVSQLPIGRTFGRGDVQFVGHYQAFLIAHESLLEVSDAAMRASEATIGSLLVPWALGLECDSQVLWRRKGMN